MYWIERGADGSYLHDGREYPLLTENLVGLDSYEVERSENDWVRIVFPFELETEHGSFAWDVEIIEYLKIDAASLIGFMISSFPTGVILKDEVELRLQDGWA
ncbi:hypothetical protein J2Y83_000573 [Pseudomonas marginalis]|uniref:hypothetical protein n=1 Tax=Pseudomonas marginalis TaxID=298 RepID=UPI0020A1E8AB|nr:hypothetical protein [Pseudomonas marginalis]MCP1510446.1 hypothetical protein [Pseudomonas marginalis]MCP1522104.1 hypothetical protein [Pseudomonas marginalis]MDQ0501092.1 hypothetical protein [Pseudomonas marginalis]